MIIPNADRTFGETFGRPSGLTVAAKQKVSGANDGLHVLLVPFLYREFCRRDLNWKSVALENEPQG
jgi:hypothetical protein